eukprot:9924904-Alexandrium_andersonii.AAC.1
MYNPAVVMPASLVCRLCEVECADLEALQAHLRGHLGIAAVGEGGDVGPQDARVDGVDGRGGDGR